MASTTYSLLNSSKKEIRTLLLYPSLSSSAPLKCSLKTVSLDSNPVFEALSYTWGTAGKEPKILLDGQSFVIFENLEAALLRLRKPLKQRTLWIDAVCINQNDLEERRQQVMLMKSIYQQATQVIIWLGEPGAGGRVAMLSLTSTYSTLGAVGLRSSSETGKIKRKLKMDDYIGIYQDFSSSVQIQARAELALEGDMGEIGELLDRPWWKRVWIVQEAVLAKRLVILCGGDEAKWEDIGTYFHRLPSRGVNQFTKENEVKELTDYFPFPHSEYTAINQLRSRLQSQAYSGSIYEFLYGFRQSQCTDPRDRVFAFLGLITNIGDLSITPDYSIAIDEMYIQLAYKLIHGHQNLLILNCRREFDHHHFLVVRKPAYSIFLRVKYHDTVALIQDEPTQKGRKGWVRLPEGWERHIKDNKIQYYDHNTREFYMTSPLAGREPSKSLNIASGRNLPENWIKQWDNIGRSDLFYVPNSTGIDDIAPVHPLVKLPSWVPNWDSWSSRDPEPFPDFRGHKQIYWASGLVTVPIISQTLSNLLTLQGILFDEVYSLCQPGYPGLTQKPSRRGYPQLQKWEDQACSPVSHCPYEKIGGRQNALFRTQIADFAGDQKAPEEDKIYFDLWCDQFGWSLSETERKTPIGKGLWETSKLAVEEGRVLDSMYDQYQKLRPDEGLTWHFLEVEKKIKEKYKEYNRRIHRSCANRALFITRKGYMGLAPWNAQEEDKVCILMGGCTPFLLRPIGSSGMFKLVGEIYVYGLMGGEIFGNDMEQQQMKTFEII